MASAATLRGSSTATQRVAASLGFASLLPLFLLGAIWPSPFTLAALLALPAGLVLLLAIARPAVLQGPVTRTYALAAVFLSPACLLLEIMWLRG